MLPDTSNQVLISWEVDMDSPRRGRDFLMVTILPAPRGTVKGKHEHLTVGTEEITSIFQCLGDTQWISVTSVLCRVDSGPLVRKSS